MNQDIDRVRAQRDEAVTMRIAVEQELEAQCKATIVYERENSRLQASLNRSTDCIEALREGLGDVKTMLDSYEEHESSLVTQLTMGSMKC